MTKKIKELSKYSGVGELIKWSTISGRKFQGKIKEWDNGTAIIDVDGEIKAVRGENE